MVKESFSLRLSEETKNKLELISIATGRTKSFIAIEAINNYCDMQAWQISAIQEDLCVTTKIFIFTTQNQFLVVINNKIGIKYLVFFSTNAFFKAFFKF